MKKIFLCYKIFNFIYLTEIEYWENYCANFKPNYKCNDASFSFMYYNLRLHLARVREGGTAKHRVETSI